MAGTSKRVNEDLRTQLVITMRAPFARRYAKDRSLLDVGSLLRSFSGARIIGRPGFSMRLSVQSTQVADLERRLTEDFVVEPDHAFECFDPQSR